MSELIRMNEFCERIMPEPSSGCWLWVGSVGRDGYGTVYDGLSRYWRAHRLSWDQNRGEIPLGMHVLHRCDIPTCVNPEHLFLGTDADNTRDKVAKGRHRHGESGAPKLTEEMVRQIIAESNPDKYSGSKYGISSGYFFQIRNGKHWKHIPRSAKK
jgi:hypothetical protein